MVLHGSCGLLSVCAWQKNTHRHVLARARLACPCCWLQNKDRSTSPCKAIAKGQTMQQQKETAQPHIAVLHQTAEKQAESVSLLQQAARYEWKRVKQSCILSHAQNCQGPGPAVSASWLTPLAPLAARGQSLCGTNNSLPVCAVQAVNAVMQAAGKGTTRYKEYKGCAPYTFKAQAALQTHYVPVWRRTSCEHTRDKNQQRLPDAPTPQTRVLSHTQAPSAPWWLLHSSSGVGGWAPARSTLSCTARAVCAGRAGNDCRACWGALALLVLLLVVVGHRPCCHRVLLRLLLLVVVVVQGLVLVLVLLLPAGLCCCCCCAAHGLHHLAHVLILAQHILQEPHGPADSRVGAVAAEGQPWVPPHPAEGCADQRLLQELHGLLPC